MQISTLELLFYQLLNYRNQTDSFTALGPWLQKYLKPECFPDLSELPFQTGSYTRNRIAQESMGYDQSFEALIMYWDQNVETPVHGHPAFSFYYVMSGCFYMENFTQSSANQICLTSKRVLYPGEMLWSIGKPGRYDNFIHKVTCLEKGHTFHIYSEDAKKGKDFSQFLNNSRPTHHPIYKYSNIIAL